MKAYKFLLPGAIGPFSGFRWPAPDRAAAGPWVEADGDDGCKRGVHACLPADLPFWLHAELWEVELGGEPRRTRHKLVAARGRLCRRVESWDEAAQQAFSAACIERLRNFAARRPEAAAHLGDVERFAPHVHPAAVASLAARAAEAVDGGAGYDAERAAQAVWLADRLGLEGFAA